MRSYWRILQCSHCKKFWNRDVNASLNIMYKANCIFYGRPIASCFIREKKEKKWNNFFLLWILIFYLIEGFWFPRASIIVAHFPYLFYTFECKNLFIFFFYFFFCLIESYQIILPCIFKYNVKIKVKILLRNNTNREIWHGYH